MLTFNRDKMSETNWTMKLISHNEWESQRKTINKKNEKGTGSKKIVIAITM